MDGHEVRLTGNPERSQRPQEADERAESSLRAITLTSPSPG
jgi:hypothetical protein